MLRALWHLLVGFLQRLARPNVGLSSNAQDDSSPTTISDISNDVIHSKGKDLIYGLDTANL